VGTGSVRVVLVLEKKIHAFLLCCHDLFFFFFSKRRKRQTELLLFAVFADWIERACGGLRERFFL
jgi:hypothetical protein